MARKILAHENMVGYIAVLCTDACNIGRKGAIEPPSHAKDIFRHSNAPLLLKIRSIRIEEQKIDAKEYTRYLFVICSDVSCGISGVIPTTSRNPHFFKCLGSQSLFVFRNLSFSDCRVVAGKN